MNPRSALICLAVLLHPSFAAAESVEEARVRAFVLEHGNTEMPLLEARGLGSGALPAVAKILSDPNEKALWAPAIQTVAFIGSNESYPIIHDFIWRRFTGAIDDTTMRVIVRGISVLGAIPEHDAPGIHRQLALATEPSYWRSLPWTCQMPDSSRDKSLAVVAAYALQWTGSSTADSVFKEILRRDDPILSEGTVAEFAGRNAQVRSLTLEGYLRERADSIAAGRRDK